MKSRTRQELVLAYAEEKGLQVTEAKEVINSVINAIKIQIKDGRKLSLRGFGTFTVKEPRQKKVRNFKTEKHEVATLPAKVHFKSAIEL